jgi:CRISPR-associated exonuclease Cas4
MSVLVLLLLVAGLLYVGLTLWSRRARGTLGLPNAPIVAADDSYLGAPTLRSVRYGLVGRPDQLIRAGGVVIPVEQKPRARQLQPSHVLQVAAQCLLVQEVHGVRPPYGLVVLAGGRQERVAFTRALEQRLLNTMALMRGLLRDGTEPGPRWVDAKCHACGFRTTCWD